MTFLNRNRCQGWSCSKTFPTHGTMVGGYFLCVNACSCLPVFFANVFPHVIQWYHFYISWVPLMVVSSIHFCKYFATCISLKRLFLAGNFPIALAPRPMLTKYLAKPIAQKFSRTSCNLMHILNFNLLNVPTPCPRLTKMLPLFFALIEFFDFSMTHFV